MSYTLISQAELINQLETLNKEDSARSFLFYSIVQGNTLDFKGTTPALVKRLVGAKFFELVPMRKYKKGTQAKPVYQYHAHGSAKFCEFQVENGADVPVSVSEYLEVEIDQSNDYFEEFNAKLDSYFSKLELSKESDKKLGEELVTANFKAYCENGGRMSLKEYKVARANYEKAEKALATLKELGMDTIEQVAKIADQKESLCYSEE
ncbi:hypothetical protein PQC39_gp103 [Vibrio phage Vp_R1]|uniref:Uncharacterized protein n=1 Tax=Vibrio phage Vp_R1 TaxID=2059867 RepID=A0A2H5BQ56_9CAUD|nr:hypothetical protein PQC39_gp103 [Vibrio phage Vp_R1]AUG88467.1 hypothetical protein VPR_103 [Vibrio phage Vp_R1]